MIAWCHHLELVLFLHKRRWHAVLRTCQTIHGQKRTCKLFFPVDENRLEQWCAALHKQDCQQCCRNLLCLTQICRNCRQSCWWRAAQHCSSLLSSTGKNNLCGFARVCGSSAKTEFTSILNISNETTHETTTTLRRPYTCTFCSHFYVFISVTLLIFWMTDSGLVYIVRL